MERSKAAKILGVDENANPTTIKKAYRHRSKKHHPDVGGDPKLFNQLRIAHDCLLGNDDGPKAEPSAAINEFIQAFTMAMGQTMNPFTVDLIGMTRQIIAKQKSDCLNQLAKMERDKTMSEGIIKRLKCTRENDPLSLMLNQNAMAIENCIRQLKVKSENLDEAATIAKHYNYTADKQPMPSTGWASTTFTFTGA